MSVRYQFYCTGQDGEYGIVQTYLYNAYTVPGYTMEYGLAIIALKSIGLITY